AGAARPQDPPVDAPERGALAVRVGAGDAGEGVLSVERVAPFDAHERGMLETVAAQLAVALGTADLVERLTEEHLVRDLFDAIADGRGSQVASRVRSTRIDPDGAHVVVVFEPLRPGTAWPAAERLESRLRHVATGALCDPGPERLRALVPVPLREGGQDAGLRALDAELDALAREEGAVAGRSGVQERLAVDPAALGQAAAAARIARALAPTGGSRAWEELGAYRYLVGGEVEPDVRHAGAVDALWRYDERRGSELVRTLERYLADRSVVPTARALSIHANTLRQRLERIEHLTDLVIAEEDLVSLELAIKLHRLRAPARLDAA
ncbi:CdaR family transcriptional regulator, partial [Patulibacter sp.]|uniref:PucR family transcriptional regulator n=1 Tax=Patulibacter sp. TaxID=1912859 RepID=UPI00271CAB50